MDTLFGFHPLLSIIIPTRNRQKYCIESVKHIISLGLKDVEVVIQDNSDTPFLREGLEKYDLLEKVKYEYCNKDLSFVDNFSRAIERSTGEYICIIGDDDSILINITDIARHAKEKDIDCVIPQLLTYFWPSDSPIRKEWRNGLVATRPFRKDNYSPINPLNSLKKLIKNNFQDYQSLKVPRVYHGIVKRECLQEIKRISGKYFGGLTPDMFVSVCLCFTAPKTVVYSKPFTISGICPKSGSADSATGRHTGELKDAPHFRGHSSYEWISAVPALYTVETIWAETGLQALKMMGQENFFNLFSSRKFGAYLAVKYPQFYNRLLISENYYGISLYDIYKYKYLTRPYTLVLKQVKRLNKLLNRDLVKKIYNVKDIKQASEIICSILKINK